MSIVYQGVEKIKLLKNNIESFTAKTYVDLTDAVQELKNKYGKKPEQVKEVTYDTNGTHIITPDDGSVISSATVHVNVTNADAVDGWHVSVRDDGTPPPSGTVNTVTFVYTGG